MIRRSGVEKKLTAARRWFAAAGFLAAVCASGRATAATISPPPPVPEDGDTFDVYVADQETYDSNLYRVSPNFGPIATPTSPNATKADYINTGSLGGDAQLIAGRQVFVLDLLADEYRFAHNSVLNDTAVDAKLRWDWRVGPYVTGQLGGEFSRALAAFAESRYLGKDLVDTKNYFGNGRYQLGPSWALFGGVRDVQYSHSADAEQYNDFTDKSGDVGVEYATNATNTFALTYSYTDGYFPQDYIVGTEFFNRNYHENTTRLSTNYAITEKTAFIAYAGYLKRDYLAVGVGHFSGDIWRASLDWKPTDKTDLVASAWHELHAYSVNESNYFISKGGSLAPVWNATEKVTVSLVFSVEDQDYINSSTSVITTGPLSAKITAQQLNILYTPRDKIFLNAFFRHEQRSSNQENYEYDDQRANLSITYKFH